jgi:molybdopterin-guanine dinucleotide biosynthesis protein A
MGSTKATLDWHGSTLVRRVAGIISREVAGPVVLVRSPGQLLPVLPASFEVLDDLERDRGPLAGLGVAFNVLYGRCESVYVSSTDVPFLHPAFVRHVLAGLTPGLDACVPSVRGIRQPLAAAYRVALAGQVRNLLDSDRLRVSLLLEACKWRELDDKSLLADPELAEHDSELNSVTNLNSLQDYEAAKALAEPLIEVRWVKSDAQASRRPAEVRAATLGRLSEAVGSRLDSLRAVMLNGLELDPDPEEPLVCGDVVSLEETGATP